MEKCPKFDINIGFIAQTPFHFHIFKNVIKHLSNAEFIVGEPYSFDEPAEIAKKRMDSLITLIEKGKFSWRFFDYKKDRDPRAGFFEKYKTLVSTTANGIITSRLTGSIKKVRVQYGQSKDVFEFGDWNRHFDLILAQGPYSAERFEKLTKCAATGFPKFDDWFNEEFDADFFENLKKNLDPDKKTLLYLPTHGSLSSLGKYEEVLTGLRSKYNILIKFHPGTVWNNPEIVSSFQKRFSAYDDSADILPMLKAADIVISDNGGAAFDALLSEKPLVILESPIDKNDARGPETDENSIEQIVKLEKNRIGPVVDSPEKLLPALEIAGHDFFGDRRKKLWDKLFSIIPGKDGERAADEILKLTDWKSKYSLIIPTHNRSQSLLRTLGSAINQSIPPDQYEIIVIDDGSTDDTEERVSKFKIQNSKLEIRYFKIKNGGPAKARNKGIEESKGDIIFFTDDDCVVPHDWMETLLDGFKRHPEVVGVGGWYKSGGNGNGGYFQNYIDFFDRHFNSWMSDTEIKSNLFSHNLAGNTANMAYKKAALEEAGGFDENLYFPGAVDWELKKNIQSRKLVLLYIPLFVEHLKKLNLINFAKKYFNQGRGRYYMSLKYPDLENSGFNLTFFRLLKDNAIFLFISPKFFLANLIGTACFFLGRLHFMFFIRLKADRFDYRAIKNFPVVIERKIIDQERTMATYFNTFAEGTKPAFPEDFETKLFHSLIIPTHNRSQSLLRTLGSAINQSIPPDQYEIIVIDDGSTDDTEERVSKFKIQNSKLEIRYFKIKNGGPAKARNKGIEESKGDIIFFTDDDCVVPHDWMETLLNGFKRHPEVVGVGGWFRFPKEILAKNFVVRYLQYVYFYTNQFPAYVYYHNEIKSDDPYWGLGVFANNTANLCVKKEILKKIGGFRTEYFWPGSEDSDLAFRILCFKQKLLYVPIFVRHDKEIDFFGMIELFFKRGANFRLFVKFNKEELDEINSRLDGNHDSLALLISRLFYRPQKLLTLLQFFSHKAGMIYMKNKLGE